MLDASSGECHRECQEDNGKDRWQGGMGRGLHAEDSCVTEALVVCRGRQWGAHFVDVIVVSVHTVASHHIVDTETLAHLQAGAGAAARSRGGELRVVDGVDAAVQQVQSLALRVFLYLRVVCVARHELPVDDPRRFEAGGVTGGELVVEQVARCQA